MAFRFPDGVPLQRLLILGPSQKTGPVGTNVETETLNVVAQDGLSTDELLLLVYKELRQMAAVKLQQEPAGQTLQATALVHEVYLRLTSGQTTERWNNRGHFFAAAAEAMRRILIERARSKSSLKRGGDYSRAEQTEFIDPDSLSPDQLMDLNQAISKLERIDLRKAEIVKLRFFVGLTNIQAADVLGVSESTAESDWAYARCWLRVEMSR